MIILASKYNFVLSLYESFSQLKDPRRSQGKRIYLEQLFCIITVSNLCGHFGGRAIARFAKYNETIFSEWLKLRHKIPSHVIFTDILNRVDHRAFIEIFNSWAVTYVPLEIGESVSGDGKVLSSTVSNANNKAQDFEAIVSIFGQESGLVYAIEKYQNKKGNEIDVVRFLIGQLKDMGLVIHLDALHAQKKRLGKS